MAVQYSTDPQAFPDRHHFDNPVYAFQGPQDNIRLLNNLVKPSSVNRCNETDSTISNGSRAGAYSINYGSDMSQKNFNADLTNPNIYHSIEDPTKEDHVYDEIKHKEEYKDIGE